MQVSVGAPVEYTTVGSVVSDQRIDVTTRLSGYIRAVLVQEGDRVRRGQVLVRLDTSDVEASIRQAQAGDTLRSHLAQATHTQSRTREGLTPEDIFSNCSSMEPSRTTSSARSFLRMRLHTKLLSKHGPL